MPRKTHSPATPSIPALEAAVREAGDVRARVDALNALAFALGDTDLRRALALSGEALRIAASVGYAEGVAWSHRRRAFILNLSGKHVAALAAVREAMARFRRLGDDAGESAALRDLGKTYLDLGRLRGSLAYFRRARELSERTGDARRAMIARIYIGQVHTQLEENRAALAEFRAAATASRMLGDAPNETTARIGAGIAERNLGHPAAALKHYHAARALALSHGLKRYMAEVTNECAMLDLDARRWGKALQGFRSGAELADASGAFNNRIFAHYGAGRAALATGDADEAERHFARLRVLAASSTSRYGQLFARLGETRQALAAGRPVAARRAGRAALALARELESREYQEDARRLLAAANDAELSGGGGAKATIRATRRNC